MLNGSQHLGPKNGDHRRGFRSLTGWVLSPNSSAISFFRCARSGSRSGGLRDINVEPFEGVAEPRRAGSDTTGAASSGFVVALPAGRAQFSYDSYMLSIFISRT